MVVVLGSLAHQDEHILDACPMDLSGVSSFGRLCRRTPMGASCLEIAGSEGIRSCAPVFLLAVWFQMERGEAPLPVTIMCHVFDNPW
jgi:hypothetical protein